MGDDEGLDGVIYLELSAAPEVGRAISIHGWIRHWARTAMGRVLVGVELRRLDVDEMHVLRQLADRRAVV